MEKMRVMLMLMPAAMLSSMAGMPSGVAGILIMTFGRPSRAKRRFAAAAVPAVSRARMGETSRLQKPSPPLYLS